MNSNKRDVIVCRAVGAPGEVDPGSIIEKCSRCQQPIWFCLAAKKEREIDLSMLGIEPTDWDNIRLVCGDCGTVLILEGLEKQQEEISATDAN